MRTGTANIPLHGGKAPHWLMKRMAVLGREIVLLMSEEYGTAHVLERLSDPFWFQAFGCVLGFDWHSSGVTTTVCGALKEGLKEAGKDIGLYVCGGKGGRSRRTPAEVQEHCFRENLEADRLVRASRLSAKIDSVALQDGYQLYHHAFFFNREGHWCVVQQGMADENDVIGKPHKGFARRYHWLGDRVSAFDCEPHSAICCDQRGQLALDLVARDSVETRGGIVSVLHEQRPEQLVADLRRLPSLNMERRHEVLASDINPSRMKQILLTTYAAQPTSFLELVGTAGLGPKSMRALALISELVHGHAPSFKDPARYSFAHGGKDGIPYPVNRDTYASSIETIRELLNRARIDRSEKQEAFRRLARFDRTEAS